MTTSYCDPISQEYALPIKRIDHIAIVVPNVEEAAAFYQEALGLKIAHVEEVEGQEVIVAFLPAGESEIELVEPVTETSGVARFLTRHGPGVHHICLEVDDIEATLASLKGRGVELINEQPTIGSGGKRVAFIHPRSAYGVLVELYETTPEEPLLRLEVFNRLRERLDIERQAVSAGVSAFLHTLRVAARLTGPDETIISTDRGVTVKPGGLAENAEEDRG